MDKQEELEAAYLEANHEVDPAFDITDTDGLDDECDEASNL